MVCYTSLAGVHLPEGAPEMFNNSGCEGVVCAGWPSPMLY